MVNHFYQVMLIPLQSHHDPQVCTSGIAMSGGDGVDFTLQYVMSDAYGSYCYVPLFQAPKTAAS
jgi:hypothetical protein